MPVTPPFFAHGRVLRTADRHEARVACDTDVTANALADVFVPTFFYFIRQERVSNGRTRRTDQVHDPALDGGDHAIW